MCGCMRAPGAGPVAAPLEEDEEDGGWKSALLRRLRSGSTGLLFRERDRKKRFEAGALAGWWVWFVVEEAAVEEAASDLSERLEAKTAAIYGWRSTPHTMASHQNLMGHNILLQTLCPTTGHMDSEASPPLFDTPAMIP